MEMLKRNKKNLYLLIIVSIAILIALFNIRNVRDFIARQNGTISIINAKTRMKEKLNESYPGHDFEFVSGAYINANEEMDDTAYTGKYIVDGEKEKIIEVVYSDKEYASVLKGNIKIEIQSKKFERKITLINRLSEDYKKVVLEKALDQLSQYIYSDHDIKVRSLFQNPYYAKELPKGLNYGMKFDKDLPLDFVFQMNIQFYDKYTETEIARQVIETLHLYGFHFVKYDFIIKNENGLKHYIFDDNINCTRYYWE